MQNAFLKQFPDLMSGKTVMYVHGFASSAQTGTVKKIAELLPNARVVAYDLPLHPHEALDLLRAKCEEDHPDLIVGTSMGGMFTEQLRGFDRIVVNPAFEMAETMKAHNMMGKQVFSNPRADGVQEFFVTKALVGEYKEVCEGNFKNIDEIEENRVFGLFGDEDETVDTYDLFAQHYPNAIRFHGGHRLTDTSLLHGVIPVIRWIDDRQEHRERRIVYVAANTLKDSWDKPRSSLLKAYNMLIENYDVYIVAPAPWRDPDYTRLLTDWVRQYVGVPAHDRIVFANDIALLYGDYLVSSAGNDRFAGTLLELGSDEFKTWEEIIVYFERLGGQ